MNIQPQGKVLSVNLRRVFFVQKSALETNVKNPPKVSAPVLGAQPHLIPSFPGACWAVPCTLFPYSSPFWCFLPFIKSASATGVTEGLSCVWPQCSGTC